MAGTPQPDGNSGDGEEGAGGRRSGRQRIKSALVADDDFVDGETELDGSTRKKGGRGGGASGGAPTGGSKGKPKVRPAGEA